MAKVTLPKLLKKTQTVFNAYIRERDKDKGCISCGGNIQQAGHYFSQGNHSALRFDETNVHGQCIRCNMYLHGNLIEYGMGLVERYGSSYHLTLLGKSKNKLKKWTRQELEEIINKYK
jgi:hypothetical protein